NAGWGGRPPTWAGATGCGTSRTRSVRPAAVSTNAQAVLVVPRSMPTRKRAAIDALGDLHLGRRDEVRVPAAARGERGARHAPARVAQHAAEGRSAADVAREPDRRRIEAGLDRHHLAFGRAQHRLERDSLVEHLAAALVDAAHGGADLFVRVGREVLGHEVDEAAFLLEEPEETERLGTCRL